MQKKLYFSKLMENNKDMLFHQSGARMNSHRRNSTKSLVEAGRIQHLVQTGFQEPNREDWAELYTIY